MENQDQAKAEGTRVGWRLWLWWLLATTVGSFMGSLPLRIPGYMAAGLAYKNPEFMALAVTTTLWLGLLGGALLGTPQWFVLLQHVSKAGWWIVASALGGSVGFIVALIVGLGEAAEGGAALAVFGTSVGVAQWLVLRRHVSPAGWWMPAVAGAYVLNFLAPSLSIAVAGPITGAVLVWLLRQPAPLQAEPDAE